MKLRGILTAVVGGMLLPAFALAAEAEVVIGDAGIVFHDEPASTVTREQVLAELRADTKVAPDGWIYVGGDAVWAVPQSRFVFQHGKLVHAADCPLAFAPRITQPRLDPLAPPPGYTGA